MSNTDKIQGWVIDRDYFNHGPDAVVCSREGWGMSDKDAVLTDYERILPRSVSIETGLNAARVDDPIRFRVRDSDDEVTYYGGAISRSWWDSDEDLPYHIHTFCEADVGGVDVQFRGRDLDSAFVAKHREINCVTHVGGEDWVTVYG